jgi:hypothetical protein
MTGAPASGPGGGADRHPHPSPQLRLTAEHPEIDVFCAHDPAPLASPSARPAAPTQRP